MKNRARRSRKLIPAGVALVLLAVIQVERALRLATGALNPVRPAELRQTLPALSIASELLNQLHDVRGRLFVGGFLGSHIYV